MEGLPSSFQHNDNAQCDLRLAAVELAFKEHDPRFKVIDQKVEAVTLETNKLGLILYGASEEVVDESNVDTADIAHDHLKHVLVNPTTLIEETTLSCFGKPSSKPRPLLLSVLPVQLETCKDTQATWH